MVKPDGVARGLVEEVKNRIKNAGFIIEESKSISVARDEAERLYLVHKGKSFYNGLVKSITSGPVFLMKLKKENAIVDLRSLMGATDPRKADPGTIRGDLKEENIFNEDGIIKNIIHGSDSQENARYEFKIFF